MAIPHADLPRKKLKGYADALALDQLVRSHRARALGWSPTLHSVSGNVPRLLEEWPPASYFTDTPALKTSIVVRPRAGKPVSAAVGEIA